MSNNNEFNWSDVLKGVAILAGAAGLVYLSAKGIDQAVDEMLTEDVDSATSRLIKSIPNMDETTWNMLLSNLSAKAQYNRRAENLYNIAAYIQQSNNKLDEILSKYDVQNGIVIMRGILANRNDFEQAIFAALLKLKAQTDLKAEATLGYMKQLYSGG